MAVRLETIKTNRTARGSFDPLQQYEDWSQAVEGIADHSCILYDTPVAVFDKGNKWPEMQEIAKELTEQVVLERWLRSRSSKRLVEAVRNKDVDKAWETLSKCAEATLTHGEGKDGRHALQPPVSQAKKRTGFNRKGTVIGRTLWKEAGAIASGRPSSAAIAEKIEEDLFQGQAPTPSAVSLGPCNIHAVQVLRDATQKQQSDEQKQVDLEHGSRAEESAKVGETSRCWTRGEKPSCHWQPSTRYRSFVVRWKKCGHRWEKFLSATTWTNSCKIWGLRSNNSKKTSRSPLTSSRRSSNSRQAELVDQPGGCQNTGACCPKNFEHFVWDCKEMDATKARSGMRLPQNLQERKVLMPSCIPFKAEQTNFEEVTKAATLALEASEKDWTPVASDGCSEGKRSAARRGSVGLAVGNSDGATT